jgi:ATP-dependent exoDNAse (exonuclease V) alpha subunit
MAIFHYSSSSVSRSKGQNAIASAAYASRSKLELKIVDKESGIVVTRVWDYSDKAGLAFSKIFTPDNAPDWCKDRQTLWQKAEDAETRINSRTAYKMILALPKELSLEQNIDLIEEFVREHLTSRGMVVDVNIHYDDENNPHAHLQTTTRELIELLNGEYGFGNKVREWQSTACLRLERAGWADVVNKHLELHGFLDRVSHLSHKDRGIDLIPTIHEGPARHMKSAELKELNRQIVNENANAIRENPELIFQKLSINKPVFSKEDIARALSDALYTGVSSNLEELREEVKNREHNKEHNKGSEEGVDREAGAEAGADPIGANGESGRSGESGGNGGFGGNGENGGIGGGNGGGIDGVNGESRRWNDREINVTNFNDDENKQSGTSNGFGGSGKSDFSNSDFNSNSNSKDQDDWADIVKRAGCSKESISKALSEALDSGVNLDMDKLIRDAGTGGEAVVALAVNDEAKKYQEGLRESINKNENIEAQNIESNNIEVHNIEPHNQNVSGGGQGQWQSNQSNVKQKTDWADLVDKYLNKAQEELDKTPEEGSDKETSAWQMMSAELKELNRQIVNENAAAIRENPELIFQKLSISKPVFSKEDIARALSDVLYTGVSSNLEELREELGIDGAISLTSAKTSSDQNQSPDLTKTDIDIESLNTEFAGEFLVTYEQLLKSDKISLINPCDLKGRTLYALTKRVELEQRYIGNIEELHSLRTHSLGITDSAIDDRSFIEQIMEGAEAVGRKVQGTINEHTGLKIELVANPPPAFTKQQRLAIVDVLNGSNVSILEGWPGAGKTFVTREIVRQGKKAGYRVIGAAPSSAAALVLAKEAGIEAKNTALWRKEWQEDRGHKFELALRSDYYKEEQYEGYTGALDSKTILLLDEASMVELADMDYITNEVRKSGAKLIKIGDDNQCPAVGMAGSFKKSTQIVGSSKLTEIMRHNHDDPLIREQQRLATKLVGEYKITDALDIYDQLGVFNIHEDIESTKAALIKDYVADYLTEAKKLERDDLASIKSIAIGAYTNLSVNYFNIEVREKLKQAGVLKGEGARFKSGGDSIELLKGEQIVFESNRKAWRGEAGILNGEVATIIDFTKPNEQGHGIIKALVHKADGSKQHINIDTGAKFPVRFKHGYAVTGNKLQGASIKEMFPFFEKNMGYEAFNVLMSRHTVNVKMYASAKELEDIIYERIDEDADAIRAKYGIESYEKSDGTKPRAPVPAWKIGLAIAVSKRANNNFAMDYKGQTNHLSKNELVIKDYLEARELVFALHGKMDQWKEQAEKPKHLATMQSTLMNGFKFKNTREIKIDPYRLMFGGFKDEDPVLDLNVLKEVRKSDQEREKLELWSSLKQKKQDAIVWQLLDESRKEELTAIFEELTTARSVLEQNAKLICENYHGVVGEDQKKTTPSEVSMGSRIIQLNLNYETIRKHANLSPYKYFLKEIDRQETLIANPHWQKMMDMAREACKSGQTESVESGAINIESIKSEAINIPVINNEAINNERINTQSFKENFVELTKSIDENRLSLMITKESLNKTRIEFDGLTLEADKITEYEQKLLPEYLSRIYKTDVAKVLENWQDLLESEKTAGLLNRENIRDISRLAKRVEANPKLLGELKGIGFGGIIGLTKVRKDAIANIEVMAKRLKSYEGGKMRMVEIEEQIAKGNYDESIAGLIKQIKGLEQSLPNEHEQKLIDHIDRLNRANNLNNSSIMELVTSDEMQGLIHEYYNAIGEKFDHDEKIMGEEVNNEAINNEETNNEAINVNNEDKEQKLEIASIKEDVNLTDITKDSKLINKSQNLYIGLKPKVQSQQGMRNITKGMNNGSSEISNIESIKQDLIEDQIDWRAEFAIEQVNVEKQNEREANLDLNNEIKVERKQETKEEIKEEIKEKIKQETKEELGNAEEVNQRQYRPRLRNESKEQKQSRQQKESRLDWKEVNRKLTSYDFEKVFYQYAHHINEDGDKIVRKGQYLSCGSLNMNMNTGSWNRFSTGQKGDIYNFVQVAQGVDKLGSLELVASIAGISRSDASLNNSSSINQTLNKGWDKDVEKQKKIDQWIAYDKIPSNAPKLNLYKDIAYKLKDNKLEGSFEYRNTNNELLGYAVRLTNKTDGTKEVLPISYCHNEALGIEKDGWKCKGFTDNGAKPIYGAENLGLEFDRGVNKVKDRKVILIVEGEKTADRARQILPEYNVITWLGGSSSADKANWSLIKGREVVIFPDNDEAGQKAGHKIEHELNRINGHIGLVAIVNIKDLAQRIGLEKGWDLADKLPNGANMNNIKEEITKAQRQNQSLDQTKEVESKLATIHQQSNHEQLTHHQANHEQSNKDHLEQSLRILWQNKAAGRNLNQLEIQAELEKEQALHERLTSSEALYYEKYMETRGIQSSEHEFLKLEHELYRDTLVALAKQKGSNIDLTEITKDSELINKSQNLYTEVKARVESQQRMRNITKGMNDGSSATLSTVYDRGYNTSHNFEIKNDGSRESREALKNLLIRDVSILHQAQLGTKDLSNLHSERIENTIENILQKQRHNDHGYNLIEIANSTHKAINNKDWWQRLATEQLTLANKKRSYEQMELDVLFKGCSRHIDDIKSLNPNYDLEVLKDRLRPLSDKSRTSLIESEALKLFKGIVTPQINEIDKNKAESKSSMEFIEALQKEKTFCENTARDFNRLSVGVLAKVCQTEEMII